MAERLLGAIMTGVSTAAKAANNDCTEVLNAELEAAWNETDTVKARVRELIARRVFIKAATRRHLSGDTQMFCSKKNVNAADQDV